LISLGSVPGTSCDSLLPFPLPRQAVALIPLSQTHTGQPSLTVHGYRVYNVVADTHNAAWVSYDVPQLGIQIALHGTGSRRILDTLAPSARKVAFAYANEAVPSNWHAVTDDGVSLSIPRSWAIITPTYSYCEGWPTDDLVLVKPDLGVAACGAMFFTPRTAAGASHEDLSLYLSPHNIYAPTRNGNRITTVEHGATTVTVYADKYDPNALDLFVHPAGSNITHVLTLGLGRVGRIPGGVITSIRAVT